MNNLNLTIRKHQKKTPREKYYCKKDRGRGKTSSNASVINDKGYENIPE